MVFLSRSLQTSTTQAGARYKSNRAFTLIELSIVLVIIGLFAGGVLVGRDLIAASQIRAQISQIEKYRTAVNTFKTKYSFLPGDIPDPLASQLGFQCQWISQAGNGNGLIDTSDYERGERQSLWVELWLVNLIKDSTMWTYCWDAPQPSKFLPKAAMGENNYISVYSGGIGSDCNANQFPQNDQIYFGIWSIAPNTWSSFGVSPSVGITVWQALTIDSKADDGLPTTGNITASYIRLWAGCHTVSWVGATAIGLIVDAGATPRTASTCYDNSNVASAAQKYSIAQNNGNGINCALSFKF